MSNPFTLVFGQPPLEVIDRTAQVERIVSEFSQERPSNYINLVTGIRGSGKTVFITQVARRLESKSNWIVVNLNPQRDLLQSLAAKLNGNRELNKLFQEAEIDLSAFGIGVRLKTVPPVNDIEDALTAMLRSIKNHGKRVLVTIDEVTNSKDMRIFTSAFQIFMREELPVYLLMTGLYKNVDRLRNADGMTFLERAPRTVLGPLDRGAIAARYIDTLKIREDRAYRLAAVTKGYSFAFQTIGYFMWEYPEDEERALRDAREYLYEFAYWKIWSELSATDKEVTLAISDVQTGEILEIRNILNYTSNQFNPYRDRLIKAGVITSPANGLVDFALPWFGEFAQYSKRLEF